MRKNIFSTSIDENNRLTLPKDISKQIIQSLKSEDEDKSIKRAVNLLSVQIGKIQGVFLIPYIYYIRHFLRILEKFPLDFFSKKKPQDNIVTEDIDSKGRIYIHKELLKNAGLIKVSTDVVTEKVIIVDGMCGWFIWKEQDWNKVKNRVLSLNLFRKYEDGYVRILDWSYFAGQKGGLKKITTDGVLRAICEKENNEEFMMIEDPPMTYILPCTKQLYKNICYRPRESQFMGNGMMFSVLDYRCTIPRIFSLDLFNNDRVEISFRKFHAFPEFLQDNIPKNEIKGSVKGIFRREGEIYTLTNIIKSRRI